MEETASRYENLRGDNIKTNLTYILCDSVDQNNLPHDRDQRRTVVSFMKELWIPLKKKVGVSGPAGA